MNKNKFSSIIVLPDCVIKYFSSYKHFQAELFAYQLNLPMLPKLLDYAEPYWIKMEKITGIPYLDELNNFQPALLAETIANFHWATLQNDKCLCHKDNAPKNILFCQGKYYFIDFNESEFAYPEKDITHLLLFWAADFPCEFFRSSVTLFLNTYLSILQLNSERWMTSLQENICLFDNRRKNFGKHSGKQLIAIQSANRKWLAELEELINS